MIFGSKNFENIIDYLFHIGRIFKIFFFFLLLIFNAADLQNIIHIIKKYMDNIHILYMNLTYNARETCIFFSSIKYKIHI